MALTSVSGRDLPPRHRWGARVTGVKQTINSHGMTPPTSPFSTAPTRYEPATSKRPSQPSGSVTSGKSQCRHRPPLSQLTSRDPRFLHRVSPCGGGHLAVLSFASSSSFFFLCRMTERPGHVDKARRRRTLCPTPTESAGVSPFTHFLSLFSREDGKREPPSHSHCLCVFSSVTFVCLCVPLTSCERGLLPGLSAKQNKLLLRRLRRPVRFGVFVTRRGRRKQKRKGDDDYFKLLYAARGRYAPNDAAAKTVAVISGSGRPLDVSAPTYLRYP